MLHLKVILRAYEHILIVQYRYLSFKQHILYMY